MEIRSPLELYPYQKSWVDDHSSLKIAKKSRCIAYSFAEALSKTIGCLGRKQNVIVLSRGERKAKEFIEESVAPHVRAIGAIAEYLNAEMPGSSIYKHEVVFGNGSRIIALPANPETARGYEGDITLDEFAFHQAHGESMRLSNRQSQGATG